MALRKHKSFSTGKAAWLSLYADRKWVKRFAVGAAAGCRWRGVPDLSAANRAASHPRCCTGRGCDHGQVLKGTVFQMFNSQKDAQPKLRLELQV